METELKIALADFLLARIAEEKEAASGLLQRAQEHELNCRDPRLLGTEVPGWWDWPNVQKMAARVVADCEAKREIVEHERHAVSLDDHWRPDCGGDWVLSGGTDRDDVGIGYFANYWPDNTVIATVYVDGNEVASSGIVGRGSRAECMVFAEQFLRDNLPSASPVLRLLALRHADHPDYQEEWRP